MIKIVKGNILDVEYGCIVHQVNCFGSTGGLAGKIFEKYPCAKYEYLGLVKEHEERRHELMGTVNVSSGSDQVKICNMFSQFNPGTVEHSALNLIYINIEKALRWVSETFSDDYPIHMPYKMSCGIAGGDWDKVLSIIIDTLGSKNVFIHYYC